MEEAETDRARRLPPGPHGIPRDLVARNQRERLIAAMAEVCAEGGYAAATVAEVARRAGVSTASFYRQFNDRQACMLSSFEELFGRLLEEIERAVVDEMEPVDRGRAAARTIAILLAADPPTARLLSVEILAVGPPGVSLQQQAINRLARVLRVSDGGLSEEGPDPAWVVAAAMIARVAKRVIDGVVLSPAELEALSGLL